MKKSAQNKTIKTRRKYDDVFKQQALQMLRLGQSVPAVAQSLGVGEGLLYKWKQALRPAAMDQELEQLRARLKQVETERDILKKALSIFSRQT
jgi:transposase